MPTPGDSCATCFFSFGAPISAGDPFVGGLYCNRNAPSPISNPTTNNRWLWPLVQPDFWCGEGVNDSAGTPFVAAVVPPAGSTLTTGSFSMSAQSSIVVTDANCKTTSRAQPWVISGDPTSFMTVPASGSFTANVIPSTGTDGSVTGTYGYNIYN